MEEFQQIKRNRRKNKSNFGANFQNQIKQIQDIKYELCETQFYKESASRLKTLIADEDVRPHGEASSGLDIVCYGLGNFMESYISRYQLALLLALREDFLIADGCCEVYDPKFTTDEVKLLSELRFNVLDVNQEGKRQCKSDHMTMFYMPHCGKALYNNMLWRNWGPQLRNIVLIGNSFTHMLDRTPGRILEKTASYVIKIHPYTKEIPLQIPSTYDDVFNDTSMHVFLHDTNTPVPVGLWEDNSEPVYDTDEAEIIFK